MVQSGVVEVGEAKEDVMARFLQQLEVAKKIIGQGGFRWFCDSSR